MTKKNVNIGLLLFISIFTTWYLYDSYNASNKIENLLFVGSVGVLLIILAIYEIFKSLCMEKEYIENSKSIIKIIILFGLYVFTIPYLGFDVGSILFIFIYSYFLKKTKVITALLVSVVFGFSISMIFHYLMPYEMPSLLIKHIFGY